MTRLTTTLFLYTVLVTLLVLCVANVSASGDDDHDHHSDESHHSDEDSHHDESHHDSHHDDDDDHHDESHHDSHDDDHDDHDHDESHGSSHHDDDHDGHGHDGHGHGSHGAAHHDEHGDHTVDALKGMSIGVIGGVGIIVDIVVVALPQLKTNGFFISLLSSFAAGIFIVVGLSHLLAEGVDIIALHTHSDENERFRPAYMVAIAGYYVMVVLQRGVFKVDEKLVKDCLREGTTRGATTPVTPITDGGDATDAKEASDAPIVDSQPEQDANDEAEPYGDKKEASDSENPLNEGVVVVDVDNGSDEVSPKEKKNKHECDSDPVMQRKHQLNLIVLFIMFYIHGVTEGIALGLQSTTNGVLLVFIAIIAHHWAADLLFTFATGRVHTLGTASRLALAITLSLNTSVGIGIGWALSETIPSLATGYILSFCAGSFLMIAMTEIVAEEMPMGKRNLPQFLASFLGVALMYGALAGLYSAEAHNH